MKKLFVLGVLFTLAGVGVFAYGHWAQDKQNGLDYVRWQETKEKEKYIALVEKYNNATTKADYIALEKELATFSKSYQDLLIPQIKLKTTILNFEEAEEMLNRARTLQASLSVPSPPPEKRQVGVDNMGNPVFVTDPPQPPKIHPAAEAMLNKALPIYEEAKRDVDRLGEIKGNDEYNFRLNYVKGEVYHRYTQLFGTQETARALFNQTVTYYKHALRYKPADTNTVINIELLIRDEQGMGGGGNQGQQQQRTKLLNQAAGSGRSKGN